MADYQDPKIQIQSMKTGSQIQLLGSWCAATLSDRRHWKRLRSQLQSAQQSLNWDLRQVHSFDHIAAQLLWSVWMEQIPQRLEATSNQREILQRVAKYTVAPERVQKPFFLRHSLQKIGLMCLNAVRVHACGMVVLLGQFCLDVWSLFKKPSRAPWREITAHTYRMGAQALPITALVGILIGIVIAYLLALQLRQFGAGVFIVKIMGVSLTRELGPLLAAILIAGRSGSAITAQIGVMRVNEELDALRVMGISQSYRLVLPRAVALALSMPFVSLWTTLMALIGGMLASQLSLDISLNFFLQSLPQTVSIANVWLGLAKSFVFGIAIAIIGCYWGMWVKPNTESLGIGTTASVVSAITAVIIINAIFAILFRSVGF